jgi:hypothetical protein
MQHCNPVAAVEHVHTGAGMQQGAKDTAYHITQLHAGACHKPVAEADADELIRWGAKDRSLNRQSPHLLLPWWLLLLRLLLRPALPGPLWPCGAAP